MDQVTWTRIFCGVMLDLEKGEKSLQLSSTAEDLYRSVGKTMDPTIAAKVVHERSAIHRVTVTEQLEVDVE